MRPQVESRRHSRQVLFRLHKIRSRNDLLHLSNFYVMIELAGHPNRWKLAVEIDNTRGLNKKICISFLRASPVLFDAFSKVCVFVFMENASIDSRPQYRFDGFSTLWACPCDPNDIIIFILMPFLTVFDRPH